MSEEEDVIVIVFLLISYTWRIEVINTITQIPYVRHFCAVRNRRSVSSGLILKAIVVDIMSMSVCER